MGALAKQFPMLPFNHSGKNANAAVSFKRVAGLWGEDAMADDE